MSKPQAKKSKKTGKTSRREQFVAPVGGDYRPTFVHLSEASDEYLKSLLNPCGTPPVGMPFGFPAPSLKMKTFIRARFTTPTVINDVGFVALNPWLMCANTLWAAMPANKQSALFTSSAVGSAGLTIDDLSGGAIPYEANSPYLPSQFGNGALQMRLVSACLRIRYAGTQLNRGGRITGVIDPDHSSLIGLNAQQLLSMDSCVSLPVKDGEWCEIIYNGPVAPNETEYSDPVAQVVLTSGAQPVHCMGFIVDSAVGATQYEVEAYANFEIIGAAARGKTPTLVDPIGAGVVSSGIANAQLTVRGTADHHGTNTFVKRALAAVQSIGSRAITFARSDAVGAAASWAVRHATRAVSRSLPLAGAALALM